MTALLLTTPQNVEFESVVKFGVLLSRVTQLTNPDEVSHVSVDCSSTLACRIWP